MAEIRVKPPGPGKENAEILRYGGLPLQQVFESGKAALSRVRTLDRLAQLHLVTQQDNIMPGGRHGNQIRQRNLPCFVHEEIVESALGGFLDEGKRGASDEVRQRTPIEKLTPSFDLLETVRKASQMVVFPTYLCRSHAYFRDERGLRGLGQKDIDCPVAVGSDSDALARSQ